MKFPSIYHKDNITVFHGDSRDILKEMEPESVELVYTDPPYPKRFFHCYEILADECPRIMTPGGSLIMIVAHYAIPNVIQTFKGKLKYRWMFCMNQFKGRHPRMAMGIEVMWKPMLWYVKGAYPQGRGFLKDGIEIVNTDGQTKRFHKWEQDLAWAKYYISKLHNGGVIVDPFMGSGTLLLAARELGVPAIGIDIDESSCLTAVERLSSVRG